MESLLTKHQNAVLAIDVRKNAEMLITQGAKLHAVKLIKENTNLGLRECKHIADCLHEEMIISKARGTLLDHMSDNKRKRNTLRHD